MTLEQKMRQEELKIKLRTAMADMSLLDEMDQVKLVTVIPTVCPGAPREIIARCPCICSDRLPYVWGGCHHTDGYG